MLLTVLLAVGVATGALAKGPSGDSHILVIGKVSDNPRKHYRRLKPMVDYAVAHLGDMGITQGRVLMARDNAQMIEYLRSGQVDWVTETLFSAVRFVDQAGAEIVLLKRKKGVREYQTVFITREDSDIQTLDDLGGRLLAVEDPGSTTAYFLPRYLLQQAGLTPVSAAPEGASMLAADEVGLAFARGEINIAAWVHEGLADAGAYSDIDWRTPDHTPPTLRENLRIFHRAPPISRAVELLRPGLRPALKRRLLSVLLRAHENPTGRRALYAYQGTERFDAPDETLRKDIDSVRQMLRALNEAGD